MKNQCIFISLFYFFFVISESTMGAFVWEQKADFGGGVRDAAFAFSIGNYGYAGAGRSLLGGRSDFWQYDPLNDIWTQKSDYPGLGQYGLVGFSIGNYGYAGTGWTGVGGAANQYKDFWQYDPSLNVWHSKADFGGSPRYSAVGFSIGNMGYIGLGYSPMLNDFWQYDPAIDSWTQKTSFPYNREGAFGFGIGNKGYVGAGFNLPSSNYNDFYEYDPVNDTWTAKSNVPGLLRRAPAVFSIGNYGYVGMGYNDTTYLTDFYQYDPVADHWETVASIGGVPRYWSFAFAVGNYGYVGCGSYAGVTNPIRTNDFWRFSDCDGSSVGIRVNPNPHSSIHMHVISDSRKGLKLNYELGGERDAVFNLYNGLGQLVFSVDLVPNNREMNLAILLSNEIYFYSVSNNEKILTSGKVLVY